LSLPFRKGEVRRGFLSLPFRKGEVRRGFLPFITILLIMPETQTGAGLRPLPAQIIAGW
jgi:hypothetical protein